MRISTLILSLLVLTPVMLDRMPPATIDVDPSARQIDSATNDSPTNDTAMPPATSCSVSPPLVTLASAESSLAAPTKDIAAARIATLAGPLMPVPPVETAKAAKPAVRPGLKLMSAEREKVFRACFPQVEDTELQAILSDPDLVIYSDREMPKAYQFFDGAFPGVHSVNYNISANGSEPFGNGNREFPWSSPAGTHRSSNVFAYRFFLLPKDSAGRQRPVVWHKSSASGAAYSWTFPVGTIFGEVLMLHGPDKKDYTFELRIRRREVGQWEVDAFRPFPTAKSLAARIQDLRPDWESDPNLTLVCEHLAGPRRMTPFTLADTQPRFRTFKQSMGIDTLPVIEDQKLVAELLSNTTFVSASGQIWQESADGVKCCAPTTNAPFHIVPANYDAGFVAVDHQSCMRCHDSVNESVRKFNPGRDWYGHIRGSDGIFSFHPFSPDSISGNGFSQPVHMRREFEQAGILEKFDPARHSNAIYQSLKNREM